MVLGDAGGLVSAGDVVEGHGAEDGGEDHAGGVDPDEVFVELDAAAGGAGVGDAGSADGVIGGCTVHTDGEAGNADVDIAGGGVAVAVFVGSGSGGGDAGSGDGDGGEEAELLVDLEHVGAAVEAGLSVGVGLGLVGSKAEVGEGGWCGVLRGGLLEWVGSEEGEIEGLWVERREFGVGGGWGVG